MEQHTDLQSALYPYTRSPCLLRRNVIEVAFTAFEPLVSASAYYISVNQPVTYPARPICQPRTYTLPNDKYMPRPIVHCSCPMPPHKGYLTVAAMFQILYSTLS
jgi:hypothetical protein